MDKQHPFTGVDDATLALCHRAGLSEAETATFSTIRSNPGISSVELITQTGFTSPGVHATGVNNKMAQAGYDVRVVCHRHGRRFTWSVESASQGRAA